MKHKKWHKWEYWPAYMFYIPILPYYLYLSLKARHLVFFSAANPGIEAGGCGFESKYKTMLMIPEQWRPQTIFIAKEDTKEQVLEALKSSRIIYPLIIKPNVGFRGLLVAKIRNEQELIQYIDKNQVDLILQEYINGDTEYGIFYHRFPGASTGDITSLTNKVYLHVVGDGNSSIRELMQQDENNIFFVELVESYHGSLYLDQILAKGGKKVLSTIGNHSKGTTFLNVNNQISQELISQLDRINDHIEGWYYGRIDVKVPSLASLIEGKEIKILEINGLISEPTHIYDTNEYNYFSAVKEIARHWTVIYKVARSMKRNGVKYYGVLKMIKKLFLVISIKLKLERLSKL